MLKQPENLLRIFMIYALSTHYYVIYFSAMVYHRIYLLYFFSWCHGTLVIAKFVFVLQSLSSSVGVVVAVIPEIHIGF